MPKYVVAHGSLKTGRDAAAVVGETVELEESFVKEVDPQGVTFVTEDKWLVMEEVKALNARIALMSDDEKLAALRAAIPVATSTETEPRRNKHRKDA